MTKYQPSKNITSFSCNNVPVGTTEIDLSDCKGLKELPENLPKGIKILNLSGCEGLEELPKLPKGLETLNLLFCKGLKKLPELPKGLKSVSFYNNKGLKLPELPTGLIDLTLSIDLYNNELPKLPEGLKILTVWGCEGLKELPKLPKGLETLDLFSCKNLEELPELPKGLETINLTDCKGLKELPKLPKKLKTLNLYGCEGLEELPEIPEEVKSLDLKNCRGLKNTPALIKQLLKFEKKNRGNPLFKLIWPDHIKIDESVVEIKKDLAEAYRSYYQNDENFKNKEPDHSDCANYPTLALFHRFMSEFVPERGGMKKIMEPMITAIEGIKENPQILKSIDEVSRPYLDACINQPVAGFTVVANLVNISQQEDIPSKLEAARALGCIELIKSKIAVSGVGAGVEVELANAMLMKVHEKLLSNKDISKEWPGVPDGVAYEGCIEQYLTNDNIYSIYKQVKKELKKPLSDVANSMCEHSWQDFWMSQVLTKEEMKSTDEIIKLKEDICNEQNGDKLVELAAKLEQKEAESREGLLRKSKKETLNAIKPPSVRPSGGNVCGDVCAIQ